MSQNFKQFLIFLGILILAYGVWYFRTIIIYIVIAAVISIMGAPLVKLIKKIPIGKKRIPSALASLFTLITFISVICLFFMLFAPLVAEEAQIIAQIDVEKTAGSIEGGIQQTEEWLSQFNLSGDERSNREFVSERLKGLIDFNWISQIFNNIFSILGNAFVAVFSILFMSFFFLKDGDLLENAIDAITPDKHLERIKNIQTNAHQMMTRYFLGVLAQVTIISIIVSSGLYIIGVENALIIGLIAGILNLIPYIGPIIAFFLIILLAITTNLALGDSSDLLALIGQILIVFGIAQLVDNFFTQPVILGNSVRAHPLEIFIVISLAATFAGVAGMIIAIPAYTILRIIAKEFLSQYKFISSLTKKL